MNGADGEDASTFDVRRAYRDHCGALFGFTLNSVGDTGTAEDCVQETFLRAWRARARFNPGLGSERTWLFAIARNVIADALRARARRGFPVTDEHRDSTARAAVRAPAVEERLVLLEALAQLTPEHRAVITAVQLQGSTYQQVAERTGVPVATLRTRMYYGLKAMRLLLGEEGHDGSER